MNTVENANATRHYILLVIAIVIGLVGVYFRFSGSSELHSNISNVIMVIGMIIGFKAVFAIMEE